MNLKIFKNIIVYFLLCLMLGGMSTILADHTTTIYTPRKSIVPDTYITDEMSASDIAYWNSYVEREYPNAIRLDDASRRYNCHAYAWHVSEGGNKVWIGYYTATAEDKYWDDGSYVEVAAKKQWSKVSYTGNHSAIQTDETEWYKSKWGSLPLMKHKATDCPSGYGSPSKYRRLYLSTYSPSGISYNNKKNIVKDGSYYYMVFETDNEIYFTKTNDQSLEVWHPIVLISDDNSNPDFERKYPAIAERDGNLYVVWQEFEQVYNNNGYHDLKFRCCYNGNWQSIKSLAHSWWQGYATKWDLFPTIAVEKEGKSFEMIVAYKVPTYPNDLFTRRTTSVTGSSWDYPVEVPGSDEGVNPVLLYTNGMPYTKIVWTTGSQIYYSYAYFPYGISWSNPTYLSEGFDFNQTPTSNTLPTAAVSANGTIHTAWEAEDGYFNYDVIAYTKNFNTSVYSMIGNYSPYLKPSLTGHANGTASMVWHHDTGPSYIRKAYYNGSKWDADVYDCTWGEVIADDSNSPCVSITNPPGGSAKAFWLKGSSAPYDLEFGPETSLQKSTQKKQGIYHRRIIVKESVSKSVFAIELGEFSVKTSTDESIEIMFDSINDDEVELSDKSYLQYLVPMEIELSQNVEEINFYQGVFVKNIENISSKEYLEIKYNIVDANNSVKLATFSDKILSTSEQKSEQKTIRVNVSGLAGKKVIIQPEIIDLNFNKKLDYTLIHVYLDNEVLDLRKTSENTFSLENSLNPSEYYLFKNYPNPFNPVTHIAFDLPEEGNVILQVYDIQGRLIQTLVDDYREAGRHRIAFDGGSLASGIYFYRIKAGSFSEIKRMLLVK